MDLLKSGVPFRQIADAIDREIGEQLVDGMPSARAAYLVDAREQSHENLRCAMLKLVEKW